MGRLTALGAVEPAEGLVDAALAGRSTGAFFTGLGCFTCSSALSQASFIYNPKFSLLLLLLIADFESLLLPKTITLYLNIKRSYLRKKYFNNLFKILIIGSLSNLKPMKTKTNQSPASSVFISAPSQFNFEILAMVFKIRYGT